VPLVAVAVAIQQVIGVPRIVITIAIGGAVALGAMWYMRPLYLESGPVRALYDRLVSRFGGRRASARASMASEPRERSEPAQRRASERVGESEGRSPSDC
jgi:hypothetical protein